MPLKHLSNFWKPLHIPLINCGINLILTLSKNCVITSKSTLNAKPDADPAVVADNDQTNAGFKIRDTNLYVPVVTLPTKKLSKQLKTGFKELSNEINLGQKCLIRLKPTI